MLEVSSLKILNITGKKVPITFVDADPLSVDKYFQTAFLSHVFLLTFQFNLLSSVITDSDLVILIIPESPWANLDTDS